MNKTELWAAYVARNPDFDKPDAQITMTARGLKKLFEQTFDHGYETGTAAERAVQQIEDGLSNIEKILKKAKAKEDQKGGFRYDGTI